jgi:IS30 family transposase
MNTNKISDEQLKKIRNMMSEGYKVYFIAEKMGLSYSGIYRRLDNSEKRPIKRWTKEDKEKVKALRNQNVSFGKIAKLLNRNRVSVINMYSAEKRKGMV